MCNRIGRLVLKIKGVGVFRISCFALGSTVPYCDSGGRGGTMGVCLGVCMLRTEYDEGVYWVVMVSGLLGLY